LKAGRTERRGKYTPTEVPDETIGRDNRPSTEVISPRRHPNDPTQKKGAELKARRRRKNRGGEGDNTSAQEFLNDFRGGSQREDVR